MADEIQIIAKSSLTNSVVLNSVQRNTCIFILKNLIKLRTEQTHLLIVLKNYCKIIFQTDHLVKL